MKFKHSISLLLAVVLVLGLAMPAYATSDIITASGISSLTATSTEIPVTLEEKATYSGAKQNSLGVEITWNVGTLEFEKLNYYGIKWNPETLKYESFEEDYSTGLYILPTDRKHSLCTVINRSLSPLKVTAAFTPHEKLQNISHVPSMNFMYEGELYAATAKNQPSNSSSGVGDEVGEVGGTTTITMQLTNTSDAADWVKIIKENNLTTFGTVTLTFEFNQGE